MTTLAVFGLPLGGMELVIILAIVLVLFGPKRLPQLGKSLGKTVKAIREGVDGKSEDGEAGDDATAEGKAAEAKTAAVKDDEAE